MMRCFPGLAGTDLEIDSLVVWRVVGGHIYEAWDIRAVNTVRGAATRG